MVGQDTGGSQLSTWIRLWRRMRGQRAPRLTSMTSERVGGEELGRRQLNAVRDVLFFVASREEIAE